MPLCTWTVVHHSFSTDCSKKKVFEHNVTAKPVYLAAFLACSVCLYTSRKQVIMKIDQALHANFEGFLVSNLTFLFCNFVTFQVFIDVLGSLP